MCAGGGQPGEVWSRGRLVPSEKEGRVAVHVPPVIKFTFQCLKYIEPFTF